MEIGSECAVTDLLELYIIALVVVFFAIYGGFEE